MISTLITVAELAAMSPNDVLIVDCRYDLNDPSKGEYDYQADHIRGAVFANLDRDLSDLSRVQLGFGRHPLPTEQTFSALMGRWGWRPGLQVVSYDAGNGALAAARLWWLLRLCGIHEAAVLNGGYAAWKVANQQVSNVIPQRTAISLNLHYDASEVLLNHAKIAELEPGQLLDARAAARYRGEVEPLDRAAGHVPGAINRPYLENLQADGYFKPAEILRQEFLSIMGSHTPDQLVHMCGSGVTACHNLLAMEYAGLNGSRLYAPSWSGWVSDPSHPIATK